nr:PREDICTED: centrosomal protein of 295 kDa isoform X2 [Lepisosteus oculatus]
MKRKVARLKLSPNEEAQLIKQEHERRRKLRLQQVREQERYIALQIRREVQQRRDLELQNLAEELRAAWLRQRAERVRALESLYQHSLRAVGEGHRRAKENEPDLAAIAQKMLQSNEKAEERHRHALKELKTQRQKQSEEQTRHLKARRKALLAEKERSAKIASLPPPPPDPFENINVKKLPSVKMYDVDGFSVTHYHLPETCVDREAVTEQADARAAAAVEGRRLEELEKEEEQERREQLEKARLRGSHALRVVQLTQDRERLLMELEQMQQADLARRRQVVAQMPPQLFEPAHKQQELKEEKQRDLEFAFEDMYSGERRVKGDLVLRLVPEPLPVPSTGSRDGELDVTLESVVTSNGEEHSEESQSVRLPRRTEDQAQASKQALKRLLSKVRTQRDQWSSRSEAETAPETMTIESGSLDSEERDEEISTCPRDGPPRAKPPALASQPEGPETSEESIIAGSTTLLHPREQANKLRSASEKKKQEEELEVQKQEQVALLQHLEEQKRILEAHLQQALADRERLQAAILENPEGNEQPQSQKEEPSAATEKNNVLLSSSSEDEHVKKIRQYQQRLLEQNRLHKQSVEEARRCLQDYQLMLKKRYPSFSTTVVNPSTDVSAPQQPISFQQGGLHNGLLDSGLPLPEATVDQYLEPKQPTQLTFIVNPKTNGNLPPGPFPLGTHNGSLLAQSQSNSSKWCHYETSDTDNRLQTCIPSTFPITSVLGSDPSGAHAPAQNSDGDSQIRLPAQHSGREFYQDLLNAKTHPVHETFQGTFEMQRSEVDVGQLLKVDTNFHGIALQKGQLSSFVPLETSNPETQRHPLQGEAHISDKGSNVSQIVQVPVLHQERDLLKPSDRCKDITVAISDVSTSSLVAATPVQSQGRLLVSSTEILAQKHQLLETREKLARQRGEALLQQQRVQEELLMQKQNKLKEQMSRQPTSLEGFHTYKLSAQPRQETSVSKINKAEQFHLMSSVPESDSAPVQSQSVELKFNLSSQANPNTFSLNHQTFVPSGSSFQNEYQSRNSQLNRPQKPPLAKPKLGILEMIEQHELSAIQEVETPISDSLPIEEDVGEDSSVTGCPVEVVSFQTEYSGSSQSSTRQLSSAAESGCSSKLSWRERLLLEASSSSQPAVPAFSSPAAQMELPNYSSDIGRGVLSYPGPVIPRFKPRSEIMVPPSSVDLFSMPSDQKPLDTDCLSSTTISTGSFSTSEADLNFTGTDAFTQPTDYTRAKFSEGSPNTLLASSKPNTSEVLKHLSPSSESINGNSIQRIIDKYTKELNHSLDAVGNFYAPSAGMDITELGESNCHTSLQLTKHDNHPFQPLSARTELEVSCLSTEISVAQKTKDNFEDVDNYDQSSRDSADFGKDLSKPSTSVTEKAPGLFLPLEPKLYYDTSSSSQQSERVIEIQRTKEPNYTDHGDLTDSLADHPSSESVNEGQLVNCVSATTENEISGDVAICLLPWLSPTTSSQQHQAQPGSEASSSLCGPQEKLAETPRAEPSLGLGKCVLDSSMNLAPEQHIQESFQEVPHDLRDSSMVTASQEQSIFVDQTSESFHPLHPEVSLNENAENSVAFHETEMRFSEQGLQESQGHFSDVSQSHAKEGTGENELTSELTLQQDTDFSRISEESLECFRQQSLETAQIQLELQESFYQLSTTESMMDPVLTEPPVTAETDVLEYSMCHLSLNDTQHSPKKVMDNKTTEEESSKERQSANSGLVYDDHQDVLKMEHLDHQPITLMGEGCTNFSLPFWETDFGRGIMEEPELTLMSLNETTLQEEELTSNNMEETTGDKSEKPYLSKSPELENITKSCTSKSSVDGNGSLPAMFNTSEGLRSSRDNSSSCEVMFLELHSSSGSLQELFLQKKKNLIEKSAERVQEIKTRRLQSRMMLTVKPLESLAQSQKMNCKAQILPSAGMCELKRVGEVKVCTPEQRKFSEMAMYQRTERLYNQLEEVKQQKEIKMRREAYAQNREKAKQFQQKTLQKLREKRTQH